GTFAVCVPDPLRSPCEKPFHDSADSNKGGPHGPPAFDMAYNNGQMDGFIRAFRDLYPRDPGTVEAEVMGYHDRREIPNYWAYADNFVLWDHLLGAGATWRLPSHLQMVSGWSAICSVPHSAASCQNQIQGPPKPAPLSGTPNFAWTDITQLLHAKG